MSKLRDQVMEFHTAMGQPIGLFPRFPKDARVRLRAALVIEECLEMVEAMYLGTERMCNRLTVVRSMLKKIVEEDEVYSDLVALADSLADIDYVVEGTRLEFGIDGGPIADEVHRSNMAKVGGPISPMGKMLKPEGWKPPDIVGCLNEQIERSKGTRRST